MSLFRRKKPPAPPPVRPEEQAVITHLPLSDDAFGTVEEREAIFALEDRLIAACEAIGAEHDGHEVGGGEVVFYAYGPDADRLFDAIRPCLEAFGLRSGAYAIKRYGEAADRGAREERVPLA